MSITWNEIYLNNPVVGAGDPHGDYRARVARLQLEDAERRQQALREQSSVSRTAGERIRLWERLHAVTMPRRADHALLAVIAADTGLTLDEVSAEQQQRAVAGTAADTAASPALAQPPAAA